MTPRQRILATLSHQRPDRTATDGWFHPETMDMLKRHYRTDAWPDVLRELGIEGWVDIGPILMPPDRSHKDQAKPGHASGEPSVWLDDRTYEDIWGVRFVLGSDKRYRRWVAGPLEDARSVGDVARFSLLETMAIHEPDDYARLVSEAKHQQQFVYGTLENPFRRFWNLRGYENALMDYAADPEIVEAVYDRLFALYTRVGVAMARAGVDMIRIVGDIAMQDRIIMGPEAWRRFDKPRIAALIGACREVNPDLEFFFHSDGMLTELMDDLIDAGFTVINPIQPECMDPVEVKRRWGDRITLHGCISIQRTLPFGSPEDVRAEVEHLIRQCGHNGGLVLMPSNNIQPDTPVENIIACYHTARDTTPGV